MCCFRAAKSRAAKRKGVKSLTEGLEKIENVRLSDDETKVVILDQEKLPNEEEYLELDNAEDIYEAIFRLKVRGAPAIGICAGYGIYVLARQIDTEDFDTFYREFKEKGLPGFIEADSSEPELGPEPDGACGIKQQRENCG